MDQNEAKLIRVDPGIVVEDTMCQVKELRNNLRSCKASADDHKSQQASLFGRIRLDIRPFENGENMIA